MLEYKDEFDLLDKVQDGLDQVMRSHYPNGEIKVDYELMRWGGYFVRIGDVAQIHCDPDLCTGYIVEELFQFEDGSEEKMHIGDYQSLDDALGDIEAVIIEKDRRAQRPPVNPLEKKPDLPMGDGTLEGEVNKRLTELCAALERLKLPRKKKEVS